MKPIPQTKVARQAAISTILERQQVASQSELRELLAAQGIDVTQATLSRDLLDLRATKVRDEQGRQVYALSASISGVGGDSQDLARWCAQLLVGADHTESTVVLRTPAGAAQFLASAIDGMHFQQVLGSVAGDDTIIVICRSAEDAVSFIDALLDLAEDKQKEI
ncbi:MAG: arginine repressor [Varibaculum sp.]|nr:arginine repressor [Varibaculum sp.]